MEHPDEYSLDLFTLKPDLLTVEARAEIEGHLRSCRGCGAIVKALTDFYANYAVWEHDASLEVEEVMRRLYPQAAIIRLKPYKPRPIPSGAAANFTTVLAAATPTRSAAVGTIATLSSPDQRIIARVRQMPRRNCFQIWVHGMQPDDLSKCLVMVPGTELELALDRKGRTEFEIPEGQVPEEWTEVLLKMSS